MSKHLPLLVALCIISVPGTEEMLEIGEQKAWPWLCAVPRQAGQLSCKHMVCAEYTKVLWELRWESAWVGEQSYRTAGFPANSPGLLFLPPAASTGPHDPLEVSGWTVKSGLIGFYFSHSVHSWTLRLTGILGQTCLEGGRWSRPLQSEESPCWGATWLLLFLAALARWWRTGSWGSRTVEFAVGFGLLLSIWAVGVTGSGKMHIFCMVFSWV